MVTSKKQLMVVLGTELYWDRERTTPSLFPSTSDFPDKFFGIGRDTKADDEEDYTPEQFTVDFCTNAPS